jgi:hypothetical protein
MLGRVTFQPMFSLPSLSANSAFVNNMLCSLVQPHRAPAIVAAPNNGSTLSYTITYKRRLVTILYESRRGEFYGANEKLEVIVRRDNEYFKIKGHRAWQLLSIAQSRTGELVTYTPDTKPAWFDRGAKDLTKMIFQQIKDGRIRFSLLENGNDESSMYEADVRHMGLRIRAYFTPDMWRADRTLDIYSTNGRNGDGTLLYRITDDSDASPAYCVSYKVFSLRRLANVIETTAIRDAVVA